MQGFEIDHRAFRAQNIGRPPEHLIREAVQNAFDESPQNVRVCIDPAAGKGVTLTVADDGPGFSDEKEIWTIFASGKRDDETKRGRLGRGLKELISVGSEAIVETSGKRITFKWKGRNLSRSARRTKTVGTRIVVTVPTWKKSDMGRVIEYLRLFVPPEGTSMTVNDVPNNRPAIARQFEASLPTVKYDGAGVPREGWRHTTISLMETEDRWIYEMGIPVEKIPDEDGFRWSIDIAQRTPLRPERDMLPRRYVHHLYAYVANEMVDTVPEAELTALWMEEGVGNFNFKKGTKGKVYVERRFGSNAARAIVNDPHDRNARAEQDGVKVVRTEHVSASVRDLLRDNLPSTSDMYPVRCAETRFVHMDDWTEGNHRFVKFAIWLAEQLSLPKPTISILEAPQSNCEADSGRSGTVIRINRALLGSAFFDQPSVAKWVPLILHELAHRTGNGHDAIFWREFERLAGETADIMHRRHLAIDGMVYGEV